MKKIIATCLLLLSLQQNLLAQETYGKTFNIGLGLGYYGVGSAPALHLNYEFDVFKNFTLAPFITLQSRRTYYYDYDKVREDIEITIIGKPISHWVQKGLTILMKFLRRGINGIFGRQPLLDLLYALRVGKTPIIVIIL